MMASHSPLSRKARAWFVPVAFTLAAVLTSGFAGADASAEIGLTRLAEPPTAPAFTLEGADGSVYRLEDFRGKPLIVNFWATWCPPCRAEIPSMQRAAQMLGDEAALVAINVGEDAQTVADFLETTPVGFPVLLDSDGAVTQRWPLMGLPTTFVVTPNGRILFKAEGEREWDDPALLERVRGLADTSGG